MSRDIKEFLYAWLGRNKYGNPAYDTKGETRGARSRFKCELRVPSFNYVAFGNSSNKKDAATNAALDFCQFLVRDGKMQQSEIPSLTSSSLETPTWQDASSSEPGTIFCGGEDGMSMPSNDTQGSQYAQPKKPRYPWSNAYQRDEGTHEEYVTQKADEITASETVDHKSSFHGGWTMENSKKALNEYTQKMKLPQVVYTTKIKEANTVRTMETTAQLYVPQLNKTLIGKGSGSNKKVSESGCAMNVVRQMFHLNIMQAYTGPTKKNKVSTLPDISVSLPEVLSTRVVDYVKSCGLELPIIDEATSSAEAPTTLLTDIKLAQFPISENCTASSISWAPPLQNWNPWRASNIDEPPLAFMTMEQISQRINEKEEAKLGEPLDAINAQRRDLPVAQFRDDIVQTVANNRVTLIKGETGCGKSTQVAQFLLESFIDKKQAAHFNAVVSQPRRISAISLAERVANERGEDVGETCGYNVRFDNATPRPYGSIMFCTVGVLLRMMENGLRGISHVIIDEIHERDVDTDFVLIVLRDMISQFKDLRVVLMSATIDTNLFTNFFGSAPEIGPTPVITMHGRTFPVQAFYLEDIIQNLRYMPDEPEQRKKKKGAAPPEDDEGDEEVDDKGRNMNLLTDPSINESLKVAMSRISEKDIPYGVIEATLVDIANRGVDGAVLIFLPGWAEIMSLCNRLLEHQEFGQTSKYEVLPLHSQLTSQEQRKVFNHYPNKRKIIISTNIAETSITIDDVVYVIDSCKAKERMYTSNNNMVHFATVWASKTNVIQRRGRAGRVRAGYAFHLCSRMRFESLDEHGTAEMLRIPLHQIALTIKLLRLGSVGDFLGKALEPPPYDMVVESEAVLQAMGALDRNLELTSLGKMLARMPIEPVIAKVLILGTALGAGSVMCDVAAAMSFPTPFVPREKHHSRLSGVQRKFTGNKFSDHVALVSVFQSYREASQMGNSAAIEREFCERFSVSNPVLKMTEGARRQLVDVLRNQCSFPEDILFDVQVNVNGPDRELNLMRSLLVMALYPNVAYYTGKRKVLTIEQSSALINKYSVLVPMNNRQEMELPSPLLVFTEKVRTRCISCKGMSVITAIQLLVFGSRKIECIGEGLVRVDDTITIRMDVPTAAALVGLRPCIEALLVRSCENPESLGVMNSSDAELRQLLRDISSEDFMSQAGPIRDSLLTDNAIIQMPTAPQNRSNNSYSDWGPTSSNNSSFQADSSYQNIPGSQQSYSPGYGGAGGDWNSNSSRGAYGGGDSGYGAPGSNDGFRGGRGGRGRGGNRGWNASQW
ncbi:hypothetical protein GCK72_005620 [Caenorhabditis remanei]|uniref:RNA helicase n=1 Tax=Caenorhabditis remanei TaxID=31234 RepID=A0A6A5HF84_CAERE|nr:hypothetical protein GCK72_005620 [Caenorhabditis remanei]KAF1765667.1 hypothetical protein GCK72_005620 [Caenorhabditis remanei]